MVASGGLLANLASAYILFQKQSESLNLRGAFYHVLADALGSIGAIAASLAIIFFGWNWADAVISGVVAVLILSSSWFLIREAVDVLPRGNAIPHQPDDLEGSSAVGRWGGVLCTIYMSGL